MDSARLAAVWASWWCSREAGAKADPEKPGANHNNNQQQGGGNKAKNGYQNNNRNNNSGGNGQGGGPNNQNNWQKGPQNQQQPRQIPNHTGPPGDNNICRRYNEKRCPNHYSSCVLSMPGRPPIRLWHVCNMMVKRDGKTASELCKERHPRQDHK